MNLSKDEIKKISLGFKWNPDMDYEEFKKSNPHIAMAGSYELFQKIESRYLEFTYERC